MGNFLASIISPFEEILKFMITILHGGFSNYGVIIILLTIIIILQRQSLLLCK